MLKKISLFSVVYFLSFVVSGQCPTSSFNVNLNACFDQNIFIDNTSTNATSYYWDFCSGDFELNPES